MPRFLAAGAIIAFASCILYAEIPSRVRGLLQDRLAFNNADFGSLDRGRAVAKSPKAGDRREVTAEGAIRVGVPVQFFLQRFTDIVSFKQSSHVLQIGKFGEIPRLDDLSRLTFDAADVDALKHCRIGHCDIQLSADQIRRLEEAVNWARPDARADANRVMRELLFEYVQQYRAGGNQALLEYANEQTPLKLADELRLLVAHSSGALASAPEFGDALLSSSASLSGVQEFIYWSKEQFGLKPVVGMTHVVIYVPRRADAPDVIIASKQIYASRYFAGSLGVTLGVEESPDRGQSFYLAYANRSRPRAFPPVIGGLVRLVAQGQARDGVEEHLQLAKDRLEAAFAGSAK